MWEWRGKSFASRDQSAATVPKPYATRALKELDSTGLSSFMEAHRVALTSRTRALQESFQSCVDYLGLWFLGLLHQNLSDSAAPAITTFEPQLTPHRSCPLGTAKTTTSVGFLPVPKSHPTHDASGTCSMATMGDAKLPRACRLTMHHTTRQRCWTKTRTSRSSIKRQAAKPCRDARAAGNRRATPSRRCRRDRTRPQTGAPKSCPGPPQPTSDHPVDPPMRPDRAGGQ